MMDKDVNVKLKPMSEIIWYVNINGNICKFRDMIGAINEILDSTYEDDIYGYDSLRDYELDYSRNAYKILVELGLVKNYTGERMANLYCIAKDKTLELEKLRDELWKLMEEKDG